MVEDKELDKIRERKMEKLAEELKEGGKRIIVYSTSACPYCNMAKEYLKKKGVEYEDVDVGADPVKAQEMMSKSGQMGVPVLDIKGEIIVGFDREKIDNALS